MAATDKPGLPAGSAADQQASQVPEALRGIFAKLGGNAGLRLKGLVISVSDDQFAGKDLRVWQTRKPVVNDGTQSFTHSQMRQVGDERGMWPAHQVEQFQTVQQFTLVDIAVDRCTSENRAMVVSGPITVIPW